MNKMVEKNFVNYTCDDRIPEFLLRLLLIRVNINVREGRPCSAQPISVEECKEVERFLIEMQTKTEIAAAE